MANLTIEFEGLICHVGNANVKNHAVLVNESIHTPQIDIGTGTPIDLEQWDTVTFVGPTGSGARPDSGGTFDSRVPKLAGLMNGALHGGVLNARHAHPAVRAFVIFPAGSLSAPVPHPLQLLFTPLHGSPFTKCVAQGVRFVSDDFPANELTVVITHHDENGTAIGPPSQHTIASSTLVTIKNASNFGNHFNEFVYLSQGNKIAKVTAAGSCTESVSARPNAFTAKMQQEQEAISRGLIKLDPDQLAHVKAMHGMMASINPECTNSQWP